MNLYAASSLRPPIPIPPFASSYSQQKLTISSSRKPFSSFWHPPSSALSRDSPTSSRYASLDINLVHPIRTTQLAIAHFLSRPCSPSSSSGPFSIIHVSSIAAQLSPLLAPLYNASKHGLSGFVRTLARLDNPEQRIRVTAVAPGVIDTPLWRDNPEKLRLVDEAQGDWVSAEEVAEVMGSLVDGTDEVEVVSSTAEGGDGKGGTKKVKVEGGLILEVSKSRVRKVEQFNDEGPKGAGDMVGTRIVDEEIMGMLKSGEVGNAAVAKVARISVPAI